MSYLKLNDTAVIIESDGKSILVCNEFNYNELIQSGGDSDTLAVNYITNYFGFTQGTSNGYTTGGYTGSTQSNVMDKFPFASNDDATDVGNLFQARNGVAGTYSTSHGYSSGGFNGSIYSDVIDKFPFATDENAADMANLSVGRSGVAGQSSTTHGYSSGGGTSGVYAGMTNIIDNFPFSSDTNASDVGDLTLARRTSAGQESTTNGYTTGGDQGTPGSTYPSTNNIDKFPFASNANATDVGDLTSNRKQVVGQSSVSNGYACGGSTVGSGQTGQWVSNIERFPFATNSNSTLIADLFDEDKKEGIAGHSSDINGFNSGGAGSPWPGNPTSTFSNRIEKFSFSSDGDGIDLGDLTEARYQAAGIQV